MRWIVLPLLVLASWSQAMTCEELLGAVPRAFELAEEVTMTTEVQVAGREFAYRSERLYRADDGSWASEVLEERGQRRPADSDDGSAEPDFAFSCLGAKLEATGDGWTLRLPEQDSELPVKSWTLRFTLRSGSVVPVEVRGDFEARALFIPLGGVFSTRFADWRLP